MPVEWYANNNPYAAYGSSAHFESRCVSMHMVPHVIERRGKIEGAVVNFRGMDFTGIQKKGEATQSFAQRLRGSNWVEITEGFWPYHPVSKDDVWDGSYHRFGMEINTRKQRLQNFHRNAYQSDLVVPYNFDRWGEREAPELFEQAPYDHHLTLEGGKRAKLLNVSSVFRESPREYPKAHHLEDEAKSLGLPKTTFLSNKKSK